MRRLLALGLTAAAAAPLDLASIVSATHWNPCYYLTTNPCLWDGAAALWQSGTTTIKVILDDGPDTAYPWHTDWAPILQSATSLKDLASSDLFDTLFAGKPGAGGWNYSTFDIITYRLSKPSEGGGWNYWCQGFSQGDAANETAEFAGLTQHLMQRFEGAGKRFYLEHWEGDWSARCGGYDPTQKPDPAVQARMVQWLAARQAGVDAGRVAWCATSPAGATAGVDCTDPVAVHAAAGVTVLHGSEVNLVLASMTAGFPNNILEVIPRVALDLVRTVGIFGCAAAACLGEAGGLA